MKFKIRLKRRGSKIPQVGDIVVDNKTKREYLVAALGTEYFIGKLVTDEPGTNYEELNGFFFSFDADYSILSTMIERSNTLLDDLFNSKF